MKLLPLARNFSVGNRSTTKKTPHKGVFFCVVTCVVVDEATYSETERGYLAGIMDGEGSIVMNGAAGKRLPRMLVQVSSCDHELVEWLRITVGGFVRRRKSKNENWRDHYYWTLHGKKAVAFLQEIGPLMKIDKKRLRAEAAVTYAKSARMGPGDPAYLAERLRLLEIYKAVKHSNKVKP